jgi:hypothetical protein
MKDQLVSFEVAKLAKEKGYSIVNPSTEYVNGFYSEDGIEYRDFEMQEEDYDRGDYYLRPTQSLLQRWLRDVHDIDVYIIPNGDRDKSINKRLYHPQIWVRDDYQTELHSKHTYEESLEKGLAEALTLIQL